MTEILQSLAANLADFFIYLAIALVAVIGVVKCVLPVRRVARRLNRGVRLLETTTGEGRPVWQDVLFYGAEEETVIMPGESRDVWCVLLTEGAPTAVREIYITYYLWGHAQEVKFTYDDAR